MQITILACKRFGGAEIKRVIALARVIQSRKKGFTGIPAYNFKFRRGVTVMRKGLILPEFFGKINFAMHYIHPTFTRRLVTSRG